MRDIVFEGGTNIALKIPKEKYDATLRFYRDVLLLEVEEQKMDLPTVSYTAKVKFGTVTLWLDCMTIPMPAATWLELTTNNVAAAASYLQTNDVAIDDTLEQLPAGMHWIKDPAGNVLLLKRS